MKSYHQLLQTCDTQALFLITSGKEMSSSCAPWLTMLLFLFEWSFFDSSYRDFWILILEKKNLWNYSYLLWFFMKNIRSENKEYLVDHFLFQNLFHAVQVLLLSYLPSPKTRIFLTPRSTLDFIYRVTDWK